ncbi:MAG: GNAT family N-acetyltransferase [Chitinophagaceae bacterium]|nr:GNAT family N-acetyltransferase [Chitinophagaceae bacterium]
MKNNNNLNKKNIENLTSLWKTASTPFQTYSHESVYEYTEMKNSDWPNKLWFKEDIKEHDMGTITGKIKLSNYRLTIPYWDVFNSKSYELLEAKGFTEKSNQIAMYLKLSNKFDEQRRLEFKPVTNNDDIELWAELYPRAFGYKISKEILTKTCNTIHYYLAFFENTPVGTSILFKTEDVVGVHGVGIIPEVRRKGFAEEIMKFVLNRCIDMNAGYVTLQASAMGKGLYDKLGFTEQFTIKNYILKTK